MPHNTETYIYKTRSILVGSNGQPLFHLTLRSTNAKVGPIPVSTSPRQTCPDSCPFKANGCYANGTLRWHWDKVSNGLRGLPWSDFLQQIEALPKGQLWRMNQAGDLPGEGDTLDTEAMAGLVYANMGRRGFTYTHKPLKKDRERQAIHQANVLGFTVNLSANSPADADRRADQRCGPVVTIVPTGTPAVSCTPKGRKIIICPAQTRDNVTCASCQLCARANRSVIVGFLPHGNGAKKVNSIANA